MRKLTVLSIMLAFGLIAIYRDYGQDKIVKASMPKVSKSVDKNISLVSPSKATGKVANDYKNTVNNKENLNTNTVDLSSLSSKEIDETIAEIDESIDSEDYIARANQNTLSSSERAEFKKQLTKRDQLYTEKVDRLVKQISYN